MRDDFDDCVEKAIEKSPLTEYSFITQRAKKRSVRVTRNEGPSVDANLTVDTKFRVEVFYPILDSLNEGLSTRSVANERIKDRFLFYTIKQHEYR